MLPRVALLDPELTVGLPPAVTAATGFDALTHCLEAYLALGDHPMADGVALGGLALCAAHLPAAVANGANLVARGGMMKAAMMGAVAFQKGLGACHSLAHPLSSLCGLHHGLANALCLPDVVAFNQQAVPERVARVAAQLGVPGGSCEEALRSLRKAIGLPSSLSDVGVRAEQLSAIAADALIDGCHRSNPRPCSLEDFQQMLQTAFLAKF
jgi:alcohol dehydrogenase class IV